MMKRFLIVFTFLSCLYSANAQQQYVITQYMFNGLVVNPAYAGMHESWSFTLMARQQWSGIYGAPKTQTFTAHGPLTKNEESSAGLVLSNDTYGAISLRNIYASYAYRINFDRGRQHLSMGLQGGVTLFDVNLGKDDLIDPQDPALNQNYSSSFPNFGTGIYYNAPKFYAGFSVPFLINNRLNQTENNLSKQVKHYYLTGGGVIKLGHDVQYKPSFLIRYVDGLPTDIDVTTSFLFKDVIWVGATYRIKNSIDFILEIQFTNNLRLGYSYDMVTTELNSATRGSNEIVLNYRIKKESSRVYNPRRF